MTYLCHLAARGLNKISYMSYFVIGLLVPIPASLIAGLNGLYIGLIAAVPVAITMAVYRNMAGLEPVPVKEDIIVSDQRSLVGANHARRQFGRVIKR